MIAYASRAGRSRLYRYLIDGREVTRDEFRQEWERLEKGAGESS